MVKLILAITLLSTLAFASPMLNMLNDINATYSDKFYVNYCQTSKTLTLNDFENNSTQKRIKTDFEKLLPKYLTIEELFSNEEFSKLDKDKFMVFKFEFRKFFTTSIFYLELLKKQKKLNMRNELLEKNLLNLELLMSNSENILNYALSIILYEKLFSSLSCSSKEVYNLLKKFPPQDKSVFFEKIEDERQKELNMTRLLESPSKVKHVPGTEQELKKYMAQVHATANRYINKYYDKMIIAIKSESEDNVKAFDKYMDEELEKHVSLWSRIKYMLSVYKAEIFYRLYGTNEDYGYMVDLNGYLVSSTSVPITHFNKLYLKHIDMIQKYHDLLKSCQYR